MAESTATARKVRNPPIPLAKSVWQYAERWRATHDDDLQFMFQYWNGSKWNSMKFCHTRIGCTRALLYTHKELSFLGGQFPEFYTPEAAETLLVSLNAEHPYAVELQVAA